MTADDFQPCSFCDNTIGIYVDDYSDDCGTSWAVCEGEGAIMGFDRDEILCAECIESNTVQVQEWLADFQAERNRRDQEFKQKVALLQAKAIVASQEPENDPACGMCQDPNGPRHKASIACESGRRNHCSCEICF